MLAERQAKLNVDLAKAGARAAARSVAEYVNAGAYVEARALAEQAAKHCEELIKLAKKAEPNDKAAQ